MLINASSNEEAARFSNANVTNKLIHNNICTTAKNSTRSSRLHNTSVSELYRMANKIKETATVGCHVYDSVGTLAQKLSATQSICWCHLRKDQVKCVNCQRAAAAAATTTTMATMTTMTTKVAAGSNESAIADSDIEDDDCSDSNCDSDSDTAEIGNVTVNEGGDARSYIDCKTVTENAFVDNEVTTVLNGAKFSKIMNIFQSNINNAASDSNKCKEAFANAYVNKNYGKTAYNKDKRNSNSDNIVFSERSPKLATINLSQNSSSRSNLIECSSEETKPNVHGTKRNSTLTDEAIRSNEFCAQSDTFASARAQLLTFWLAFVAFCDAVTIKHDDPRLKDARRRQEQEKSSEEQQKKSTESQTLPGNKNDTTTKGKPTRHLKLLTNRKLIFLFVVCVFFSCLNRIEGRPNSLPQQNVITDGSPVTLPTPAAVVAATTSKAARQDESGATTARLSGGAGDSEGNKIVQQTNAIAPEPTPSEKPKEVDTHRPPIMISAHDDDDPYAHRPERYPLSQVDFDRVKTPFIIGIWILSASIAKIGFHMTPKLHLIFPESCLLIVVGVIIGFVLYFCTDVAVSPLTPNTFFFYMLPPIILDAGYFMPNRLFFDNLGTILLMAGIGTVFNTATIGLSLWGCGLTGMFGPEVPRFLDTFLFAALISAVDPVAVLAVFEEIHVNEVLYIVVFGESLLNDAVTVVMYHMMEVYNEIGISNIIAQDIASGVGSFFVVAIGGTVIGIIWGFLTGLVTRFTDHVRVIEPIFIFVMAYLAYLNAEIFHMSGILAITFCGITMKNYVEANISQKSHTTIKYALKMLSSSSETIIFMFLGVATVNNNHVWNTAFVLLTITFCSVYRVFGVVILSALANRFRLHKLSRVDQFVMSYGGLRGAVAFALVLLVDERIVKQKDMYVTTTIAVIYFTVFLQGITIKPLVKMLNVKRASKRKPTMNERIHERFMDHLMAGIEDIIGKTGNYNVRDKFKRFDNRFIRPLVIRDLKGAEPKIIETYSKLTMRDAMEVMRRNPSTIGQITATESMSALFRNYTSNCIGGRWAPPTIYTTCPSLTNLDNSCSRNLDMHELDYNPSKKDLTDAKIHHLLAEELKPYRRASMQMHRRLSYSRHAVDDRDLSTQVNYKMQMNFRRMFNDRKHHKRSKRGTSKQPDGVKQNHVSFHDFQQNGTTKQFTHDYINDVLNESGEENLGKLNEVTVVNGEDWDDGLTFTAKSSPDSDRANNNSLIAHIQNLPGFDASKARIVQHYSTSKSENGSPEKLLTPDVGPTAAESILPWRRDRSYQCIVAENPIPEEDHNISRDSDGERRVATPTATESQLPWKRQGDELSDAVQQNEFPAWASNKEYLAYNSPSATFLGGINKPKQPKSVIGLFRRESCGSRGGSSLGDPTDGAGSARGSDPTLANALISGLPLMPLIQPPHANPRLDKRSQSISVATSGGHGGIGINIGDLAHSGPFPVTASHRRNVRRGSMLELSGLATKSSDNASNTTITATINTTTTTTTTTTTATTNNSPIKAPATPTSICFATPDSSNATTPSTIIDNSPSSY
ncbi:sodium/hydrogen exchanger 3 isoform X15 [Bactrocera neohumeralis]|uniref:sodium/hydrogen exchanger 3 isoform X15 n=1 Tax=Bactrocera neohumeralis TaxID=98809 RepID=UPI002165E05D|nr:sodium/hydrogen exchanger 3 isoform X15 [Bactrocera neohumeralis]